MNSPGRLNIGNDKSILSVTGSRLIIRQGDAKVVIYGSLIRDREEAFANLNQYLGSDAVNEDIHEEGPYDQFDICDKSILSASYVDSIFRGNIFQGGRERVALASRGDSWITGSLQRNVRIKTRDLFYYDSYVPVPPAVAASFENTSVTTPPIIEFTKDITNGFAFENNRDSNNLLKRLFTYEFDSPERNRSIQIQLKKPGSSELVAGDASRFVMFYNGTNPTIDYPTTVTVDKGSYSGAASLRYGLINCRLSSPSYVFRRDSYGQFRDMLEQAKQTRFATFGPQKDHVGSAAVVASFVSASTDTAISPELTQCSNLSVFCTSSAPFSDDSITRNRGLVPPAQVTSGPNNLLFGKIATTDINQTKIAVIL